MSGTTVKPPEGPQDALYLPTDISPETLFQAIGRLRREAQDEIDRLLAFLDEVDGDGDLEPSLSFPEPHRVGLTESHPGSSDDREDDVDLESTDRDDDEEGHDEEPSLGSSIDHGSGVLYDSNIEPSLRGLDLEDQHDGAEPDVDGEPDLGSFERMTNQEKSWRQASLVAGSDRELDDCDREDDDPAEVGEVSGIGDWDGVLEQIGGHHSTHGRVID